MELRSDRGSLGESLSFLLPTTELIEELTEQGEVDNEEEDINELLAVLISFDAMLSSFVLCCLFEGVLGGMIRILG